MTSNKKRIHERYLILDFCNVTRWNTEIIAKLYRDYGVIHSKEGEQRGWEDHCQTKKAEGWFYFRSENVPSFMKNTSPEFIIAPEEPKYSTLWKALRQSQREYRSFLNRCSRNELDVNFINRCLQRLSRRSPLNDNPIHFVKTDKPFETSLEPSLSYLPDIEAYLEWELIKAVWKQSDLLKRIRTCRECKMCFLYIRRTKEFCSDQCRYSFNNEKDKKSGKRREFMRRKRAEGNVKYF